MQINAALHWRTAGSSCNVPNTSRANNLSDFQFYLENLNAIGF